MHVTVISDEVLLALLDGDVDQAINLFYEECDHLEGCTNRDDKAKCLKLCLLPKLVYLSLSSRNFGLERSLAKLCEEIQSRDAGGENMPSETTESADKH